MNQICFDKCFLVSNIIRACPYPTFLATSSCYGLPGEKCTSVSPREDCAAAVVPCVSLPGDNKRRGKCKKKKKLREKLTTKPKRARAGHSPRGTVLSSFRTYRFTKKGEANWYAGKAFTRPSYLLSLALYLFLRKLSRAQLQGAKYQLTSGNGVLELRKIWGMGF